MHSNLRNIIYAWSHLLLFLQLSDTMLNNFCVHGQLFIPCAVNKLYLVWHSRPLWCAFQSNGLAAPDYADHPSRECRTFHGYSLILITSKIIRYCCTPFFVLSICGLKFSIQNLYLLVNISTFDSRKNKLINAKHV